MGRERIEGDGAGGLGRAGLARCYVRELYRHWRNLEEAAEGLGDLARWMGKEGFKSSAKGVERAAVDVLEAVERLSDEETELLAILRSSGGR